MKLPSIDRHLVRAAPVPHWCRKMGQKPSNSANDHEGNNALNCLISQYGLKFVKIGKPLGHLAHNLKVVSSNLAPATKSSL
ncbi:MAG: hypothetical protein RBT70_09640 [Alphaproteobacteria bacterium]|nr:hypothetical protein [Alphaproteobacteria bacterium]